MPSGCDDGINASSWLAGAKQAKEVKKPIPPYEVPADFDAGIFRSLNPTAGWREPIRWKALGPQLLLSRFLDLRAQLPSDQLPAYRKVGPARYRHVVCTARCYAYVMTHGAALARRCLS